MDELSLLRSELYSGRRALSALQQELSQAHVERDDALSKLEALHRSELAGQLRSLQTELHAQRQARQEAEAKCASLVHERQRLQRARDELASTLLESQQRIAELEDALVKAEELLASVSADPQLYRAIAAEEIPREPQEDSFAGEGSKAAGLSIRKPSPEPTETRQPKALQPQIAQLKASRDKLLAELEKQFLEVDRLGVENSALLQALDEVNEAAQSWEKQAQSSLQQLDRLKDILEESASWSGAERTSKRMDTEPGAEAARAGGAVKETNEERILQECAAVARLDSQLQALCAELRKIAAVRSGIKRVTIPALLGIESRLQQLVVVDHKFRQ